MTEFLNDYGIVCGVGVLCFLELLTRAMLSHTYRRLIKAAKDMGHSEHRLMRSLRIKFETCYQLQIGVPNVQVFVDKYLSHYRVLGLHLKTWDVFCGQCMLVTMAGSLAAGIWGMFGGFDEKMIFLSFFAGVAGNGFMLLVDSLFGIHNKRELLRIDMMDYMENIYKPRMENETFHTEEMEEYQREYFTEKVENPQNVVSLIPKSREQKREISMEFTKEEEAVIRDVIREYMG